MKKTSNFLATLLIVIGVAGTSAFAAGDLETKGKKLRLFNEGKQVTLMYYASEALEVSVRILNDEGKTVYKGITTAQKGFILPFDMSNLPVGEFTFIIKEGDNEFVKTVTTKATITDKESISFLTGSGEKAVGIMSTAELPTALDIVIYDENGDVLYKDVLEEERVLEYKYDFGKIESDEVRIVIWEGEEVIKDSEFRF